jgi:hypothetical protein
MRETSMTLGLSNLIHTFILYMRLDRKKAMRSFWKDMSILSMVDSPTAMTNHGRFWKKSFSRSYALGMDSEETLHDSPGRMYHYHEWFTSFTRSGHCSDSPVVIEIHRNHCFFWWSMPQSLRGFAGLKEQRLMMVYSWRMRNSCRKCKQD